MADLFLGGHVDPATHQRTDTTAGIPAADLTTHGVIVGMTGSGKTGLGVVLIEECLSAGVPALLIDPKGDLTNLLLTFPDLAPTDFLPWVNEGDAQRAGVSVEEFAAQQAAAWRDGLTAWGVPVERIGELRRGVDMTIYTPGSSAGVPLNIVGDLSAPAAGTDPETMADEVDGYVSSVLSMLGIAADPLSSREHILLANLISSAWAQGRGLDLATLVAQVQQPPVRKFGVLEVDQFFPPSDRAAFALRLNGLLAAPSFAAWMAGEPVDIAAMLRTPDGRPRCAVITTAHLSDEERQSVTAMILAKLVTWTRRQSGTTDLRALLYMDEVAGYLPPTANPPTKKPVMLLLKQARAFGLGVVLSTQNPVDVDYKALSNAGTWMVGRLQTDRDKQRLLDGMSSASGGVDVGAVGDTISGLAKREFLLRRAGKDVPEVFTTRWAMSYLRGPLTREQIATLTAARSSTPTAVTPTSAAPSGAAAGGAPPGGAPAVPAPPPPSGVPVAGVAAPAAAVASDAPAPPPAAGSPVAATPVSLGDDETPVMPQVAAGTLVAYLDPAAPWAAAVGAASGPHLRAAAVARVHLRYDETRADLVHDEEYEAVLFPLPQLPDATAFVPVDYDERDLLTTAPVGAAYAFPAGDIASKTWWSTLKRSLADHLVRTRSLQVSVNRDLKLWSRVGETPEEFAARCTAAADAKADEATAALRGKYEAKLQALRSRHRTALGAAQDKAAAASSAQAEMVADTVGGLLGGLFGGRRSRTTVTAAGRRAGAAGRAAETAQGKADDLAADIVQLEAELTDEVTALDAAWMAKATVIETVAIPLEKTDVSVSDLRLVWIPTG